MAGRTADPIAHHYATSDHHALDRLRARPRRQLANPADVDPRLHDLLAGDPLAIGPVPHVHHHHGNSQAHSHGHSHHHGHSHAHRGHALGPGHVH